MPQTSPELVAQNLSLGLLTVQCPRCGVTCGILPDSVAWQARCGGTVAPILLSRPGHSLALVREDVHNNVLPKFESAFM